MKNISKIASSFFIAGFLLAALPAQAVTSTINPNVPAPNTPLASSVVRGNFTAAYNDVNSLWAALAAGGSGTVTSSGSPVSGNVCKFTSSTNIAPAAASDIVNLFSSCSGTQYLGADSACHNAGGGSGTVTSIATTAPITGGTITTSGTIGVSNATSGAVGVVQPDGTNITVSSGAINTAQGITTSSTPQFARMGLNQAADSTASLALTQAIGATSTDGIISQNATVATSGNQKWSPRVRWTGQGWKTNATAGSQETDAILELQPVQGAANPTFNWVLSGQVNGGGYGALFTVPSGGGFNLNSGTYQIGGTQIACSNLSNATTACSTTIGTSGATIPLNNGNNTESGNNTYSGTSIFTSGVSFTGSVPSLVNGKASVAASSTKGGIFTGQGSTDDIDLQNSAGADICVAATGTTTLNCTGLQVGGVAVSTTTGTVTSVATNNGLTGGTITSTGTLGLASISNNSALCNNSGSTNPPTTANCTMTGTGNMVMAVGPTFTGSTSLTATGTIVAQGNITASGAFTETLSSAQAFTVGPNGATNPTFNIRTNVASAATGLQVTGQAAAGGANLEVLSSGSNENLVLVPKGTGNVTTTSPLNLGAASTATGKILLNGTTSGTVTLSTNDAAGTWTMKLPTSAGSNTNVLQTDGAGNTSWVAAGSGSGGGGMFTYSDNGVTVTANTYFAPIGGGGIPQTTESNVDVPSPSSTTITNLQVGISVAIGAGNTITFTLRDGGADKAVTCQIAGASATTCSDLTHSFNVAQGDLIDWKIVTTGTIVVSPTITISANNGTSNVGVTSIIAGTGLTGGTITTTGTIAEGALTLAVKTAAGETFFGGI